MFTNTLDVEKVLSDNSDTPATENIPLTVASSNFESRRVQSIDANTLRIKPTLGSLAFSLLFVVLGLALAGFWAASAFTSFDGPGSIPLLLIGVLFAAAGAGLYQGSNEQLVVNREIGVAYVRSWHPSVPLDMTSLSKHVQPQDIKAIQTISRNVKNRSNRNKRQSTYTEYQVNLTTSDSDRHNVFVTLKSERADNLGGELARMFDVPLHAD